MNLSPTAVRRIYIFVIGILTAPGSDNWAGKAVTWIHLHTHDPAEKIEYFGTPLNRTWRERSRALRLARTIEYYEGWEIVLVGHSNGCDVILDALVELGLPDIHALHLISAACEADFLKSGLALANYDTTVYVAGKDRALWLAGTLAGRFLGFGTLGRTGPRNAGDMVRVVERPEFHHGTWFEGSNFQDLMCRIVMGWPRYDEEEEKEVAA